MGLKDDLDAEISNIISRKWDIREGRVVPEDNDVVLSGGAVKLEGTVLYADLSQSSRLATELNQRVAGKIIRAFLYCTSRLLTEYGAKVTSFDGDRVMGIFLGDSKNNSAATCALKINFMVTKVIGPRFTEHFASISASEFKISHCVGIDMSSFLAVRAGQRMANDLVWIGRAPNLAANLSEIRNDPYKSYISEEVFNSINGSAKNGGDPPKSMWEKCSFTFIDNPITVYRSSWWWKP